MLTFLGRSATSSEFISSKNQATECSKKLQNIFYFATKAIKATKFLSLNQETTELVDQEVQDMLRKTATIVLDSKEDHFSARCFL